MELAPYDLCKEVVVLFCEWLHINGHHSYVIERGITMNTISVSTINISQISISNNDHFLWNGYIDGVDNIHDCEWDIIPIVPGSLVVSCTDVP